MAVYDDVKHPNKKLDPQIDEVEIRGLEGNDLKGRDILWEAGRAIKPFLSDMRGFVGLFFYQAGPDTYLYKTITSVNSVPEKVGQLGCTELTKAVMRAYGVKVPGEKSA